LLCELIEVVESLTREPADVVAAPENTDRIDAPIPAGVSHARRRTAELTERATRLAIHPQAS
jgi:hypothetical protein